MKKNILFLAIMIFISNAHGVQAGKNIVLIEEQVCHYSDPDTFLFLYPSYGRLYEQVELKAYQACQTIGLATTNISIQNITTRTNRGFNGEAKCRAGSFKVYFECQNLYEISQ